MRDAGVFAMLAPLLVASAARADWHVWTVKETVRVLRDAPAGTAKAVSLAAARNEWESFQILLRSDTPVKGISVEARDLTGPDGARLPAADVRFYRQHQLEVADPTYRNKGFKPGWYADPLIPVGHPLTRRPLPPARFKAMPFDLPVEQTHGFWIDLFVPTDAQPGPYKGTYRVTANGKPAVELPVTLTVWDFALPRVSTMKTALGSPAERMRGYYRQSAKQGKEQPPEDWAAVDAQCKELVSRHRINAYPPMTMVTPEAQPDGTYRIPAHQIAALRVFVDTYHVNAIKCPRPRSVVKDPDVERDKLHAWLRAFDVAAKALNRPDVVFYTYLRDEPNDEEAYHYVQKWGCAIRSAHSAYKVMVVEQTWPQSKEWGDLYGAVDIWCPLFPLFREESAVKRQTVGETLWTYTALCQRTPTPWWHIDFPLLHYRVPAWIAWRYRIRGLLYWGGMSYWRQVDDPWIDPKTLDRRKTPESKLLYNGEGTIASFNKRYSTPARTALHDPLVSVHSASRVLGR